MSGESSREGGKEEKDGGTKGGQGFGGTGGKGRGRGKRVGFISFVESLDARMMNAETSHLRTFGSPLGAAMWLPPALARGSPWARKFCSVQGTPVYTTATIDFDGTET